MTKFDNHFFVTILEMCKTKYGTQKTRSNGHTTGPFVCPECGEPEAFMYDNGPFAICCNRGNNCNEKTLVRDLFPELFQTIEKTYPPVPSDPNRPGRAFLEARALRQALIGLEFSYWKDIRKTGSGGVMFSVGKDANGKIVYNGRLFVAPKGSNKSHNSGSTSGLFWSHPGRKINPDEPVYVTEGIIDALSLIEAELQAIAVLSAGQDPSKLRLDGLKKLVTAFDNDKAGVSAMNRWLNHFKDKCSISAILPDKGKDWNDILLEARGQNVKGYFERKIPEYVFNADLALCSSAQDHIEKYLAYKGFSPQLFEFKGAYYYAKPQHKGQQFFAVKVSDFIVEVVCYVTDETIKDRRVYRYCLNIYPQGRKKIQAVFEAKELATTKELTTAMLTRARCSWSGDGAVTNLFCAMIVQSGARELRQLLTIGYDKQTNSYIFPEFMIDPLGKMILPENGLFSLPGNQYIRPAQFKSILPAPGLTAKNLWYLLYAAWGNRAAVAVAWTVASWFVHQVRVKMGFFPFISLHHDPQTGKSALMRCLNRMQCIDDDGLPMSEGNSKKGPLRKLSHRSSLFIGLSEWNKNEKLKGFMENILSLYDGSALATRAAFTNGNEVIEVQFKATLMFCQNIEPFETTPQKERVISLRFEKERLSPDTREAFIKLSEIPPGVLAYFFIQVMGFREMIETSWFDEFVAAKNELYHAGDTSNRLVETHGLVLGFHRILCRVIGVDYDLKDYVVEIMKKKHIDSQNNDSTPAETFFAEMAAILRSYQTSNKRGYLQFVDYDVHANRLWVHIHDMVNLTPSSLISKYPIEKTKNHLKTHPSVIYTSRPHRFKYYKADTREFFEDNKRGWCFDLNKLGDEFDFDIRSLNWP